MPARFIPPTPNCGHVTGVTFTHDPTSGIWMCPKCAASIRGLFNACARCGRAASPGTQLLSTFKHGRICTTCQRDLHSANRAGRRS